jgi:uncharacterized damage-inducible protein DinB
MAAAIKTPDIYIKEIKAAIPASTADKEKLVSMLRESRERFLSSFAGINDEQSRLHPAEGRWSVLDTLEHLTVAEKTMLRLVTETRRPRSSSTPDREEIFLSAGADRNLKFEAPKGTRPKGRFASLDEARAQFEFFRQHAIRFVEQSDENLRATEVTHPHPAAGVITTYELLIIMAKHAERHSLQIEEIKSSW